MTEAVRRAVLQTLAFVPLLEYSCSLPLCVCFCFFSSVVKSAEIQGLQRARDLLYVEYLSFGRKRTKLTLCTCFAHVKGNSRVLETDE